MRHHDDPEHNDQAAFLNEYEARSVDRLHTEDSEIKKQSLEYINKNSIGNKAHLAKLFELKNRIDTIHLTEQKKTAQDKQKRQ